MSITILDQNDKIELENKIKEKADQTEVTTLKENLTKLESYSPSEKIGNNICDVLTMYGNEGSWYWRRENKIFMDSNQYTANMATFAIPIDSANDKNITIFLHSTDPNVIVNSWFFTKIDKETILNGATQALSHKIGIEKLTLEIPVGARWLLFSINGRQYFKNNKSMMVNYGTEQLKYEDYKSDYYIKKKRLLTDDDLSGSTKKIELLKLPKKYDLIADDNFELFYKGIMNCLDSSLYDLELTFSDNVNRGKAWKRKWEWMPTKNDIGNYLLNIVVRDNEGTEIERSHVNISVSNKPTKPSNVKNILCIGDSLTEGGVWCKELKRRLIASDGNPIGYGLKNINFIGTKIRDGCGYEGYGGWNFDSYLSEMKSNNFMNISGNFDKTNDDQHSLYLDSNDEMWKLETIAPTKIKIIRASFENTPLPQNGTLKWTSGGVNHADIVYTSSEQASGNPFWNPAVNKNDFKEYANRKGVSQIDHAIIFLGWNSTDDTEQVYKEKTNRFINELLSDFPNCKITLLGLQVPSRNGFANNYGINWKYYEKLQSVWNFNKWYQDIAENNPNIEFVNISGQFDTENCCLTTQVQINNRVTDKITVHSNGVHPATSGYYQIADAVLRSICSRL